MIMIDMMNEFGFGGGDDGNLETGSYPTVIKFNAKENKWSTYAGEGIWNDVQFPKQIAIDMPNFKRGWFKFDSESKPVRVLAKYNKPCPDNPDGPKIIEGGFKPSFEVNMYSKDLDFVVFGSQSICVLRSMNTLLNQWSSRPETQKQLVTGDDIVPVCTLEIDKIATKHGSVYVPTFKIQKFVNRPVNLIGEIVETQAQAEPKPKAKPAPKPVPVEEEFDDDLDAAFPDDDGGADEF